MAKGRAFSCLLNKHAGQEEDTSIFISDSSKGYAAAVEKLGGTEAGRSGEGTVRSAPRALPARGRGRPLSAAPGQRGWDARLRAARAWASRPTRPLHPPLPRFPRQWRGTGGGAWRAGQEGGRAGGDVASGPLRASPLQAAPGTSRFVIPGHRLVSPSSRLAPFRQVPRRRGGCEKQWSLSRFLAWCPSGPSAHWKGRPSGGEAGVLGEALRLLPALAPAPHFHPCSPFSAALQGPPGRPAPNAKRTCSPVAGPSSAGFLTLSDEASPAHVGAAGMPTAGSVGRPFGCCWEHRFAVRCETPRQEDVTWLWRAGPAGVPADICVGPGFPTAGSMRGGFGPVHTPVTASATPLLSPAASGLCRGCTASPCRSHALI